MPPESPLEAWTFLVGSWRGTSKDQFGEKGIVENTAEFTREPSDRFILSKGEAWCEGRLLNRSVSLMFYDRPAGKLKRKTFFSYGFVNHETEFARDDTEVRFDVEIEPMSRDFEGLRWRSYLRRLSPDEIATGLEVAKAGEDFRSYGESRLVRSK